jgi:hypothetical protein
MFGVIYQASKSREREAEALTARNRVVAEGEVMRGRGSLASGRYLNVASSILVAW